MITTSNLLVSTLADQALLVSRVLCVRRGPELGPARSARMPSARRRAMRRTAPQRQRGNLLPSWGRGEFVLTTFLGVGVADDCCRVMFPRMPAR